MKKFIALGAALVMLLLGFVTPAEVAVEESNGIQVCSDLEYPPYPYESSF